MVFLFKLLQFADEVIYGKYAVSGHLMNIFFF